MNRINPQSAWMDIQSAQSKSNEYRKLIGGSRYEPEEENPMLGFHGAARYISTEFGEAFAMECEALKRVRNDMGLTNVEIMVPFVRTLGQAKAVGALLDKCGLGRGTGGSTDANSGKVTGESSEKITGALRHIMMCEVPSNAILAAQFLEYYDGFSIGSNDLTQLTLGLDQGKYVGICGQGPSDHPDFAKWLVEQGITSISLNPDSVVETWKLLAA